MRPSVIWRWPTLMAVLTVVGLVSALVGEGGVWWGLSWIALAIPIAVMVFCVVRR